MPVYEYRCLECDEVFEERRPIGASDPATCPEGHRHVKRLLSLFAAARSGGAPASGGAACCGGGCGCR